MPTISEINIDEIINSPSVPYTLLQAIGQEIAERKKRDNFMLGDIVIRLCGEAVIGRPSNDEPTIMSGFAGDIGISIRALQEYRQMATFYNLFVRIKYEAASYSQMREAMRQAMRDGLGSYTLALHKLETALDNNWSVDRMRFEDAKAGGKALPERMFLQEFIIRWGNLPVSVKRLKSGEWQIKTGL